VIGSTTARRRYRILHLSDTQMTATGFDEDGVDAAGSLRRMLRDVQWIESLDAIVASGRRWPAHDHAGQPRPA
jgi:hypothetical protein